MRDMDQRIPIEKDGEPAVLSVTRSKTTGMTAYHQHTLYELVCFLSGDGRCLTTRDTYVMQPGYIYVISPHTLHMMQYDHQESHSMYHVYFTQAILEEIEQECSLHLSPYLQHFFSLRTGDELRSRLDYALSFYNLNSKSAIDQAIQQTLIKCILLTMAKQITPSQDSPHTGVTPPLVSRVMEYIDQHYDEELTLEVISTAFHCSKCYLCRLFSQTTHRTIISYLNSIRIQNACRLLRQTNLSISQISNLTGYNSTAYFDRQFRRYTGQTPSTFIEQHRM